MFLLPYLPYSHAAWSNADLGSGRQARSPVARHHSLFGEARWIKWSRRVGRFGDWHCRRHNQRFALEWVSIICASIDSLINFCAIQKSRSFHTKPTKMFRRRSAARWKLKSSRSTWRSSTRSLRRTTDTSLSERWGKLLKFMRTRLS